MDDFVEFCSCGVAVRQVKSSLPVLPPVGMLKGSVAAAGTTESCFLFGEAHQDHYRETQGAVVALFGARVSAPRPASSGLRSMRLIAHVLQTAPWVGRSRRGVCRERNACLLAVVAQPGG